MKGSASVSLNNVKLTLHSGPAISASLAATLSGSGNQASGNTINAVVIPAGDIVGAARFGLRGLPYLVQSGVLSVGASPRIDAVSPASLLAGDTVTLAVSGSRLNGAAQPAWSVAGLTTEILPGGTDSQVSIRVAAAIGTPAGNADLVLLTDAGEVKKEVALIVQRNQPRLDSVNPNTIFTGAAQSTLTLSGAFLAATAVAELDGQPLQTLFDSPSQMRAVLPPQANAGVRNLRLRTPDAANAGASLLSGNVPLALVQPQAAFEPANASMTAGGSQAINLRLPFAAPSGGLSFDLTSSAPGIANTVAGLSVPAGALTASFTVQGVSVGQAQVMASRTGWSPTTLPVAVIQPPVALAYNPVTSLLVGVMVGSTTQASAQAVDSLASSAVGVVVGAAARGISPAVGVIGTQLTLQVAGEGLGAVTAVSFVPADGLTVGIPTVSNNGQLIEVAVTIDALAAKSMRRVVLNTATGPVSFTNPKASQFLVAAPAPQLESISPQVVVAGQPATKLVVRGRNLRDIARVRFEPPQGIATIGPITTNAEGTLMEVNVQASADAASGPRVLVVVAAGGESSNGALPGNTLQVARQVTQYADLGSALVGVVIGSTSAVPTQSLSVGPIISSAVGVMVGAKATATQSVDAATAPAVGVLVGAGAFDIAPKAGVIGTTVNLSILGTGLGQVTAVRVQPSDGISVGALSINPAGTQIQVSLAISPNAAKTIRRIVLQTADAVQPVVPFLQDSRALLLVTVPAPEFESIAPQVIVAGQAPIQVTVRGRNLRDLAGVRFEPAQGVNAIGLPTANAEGTVMQVLVQASADAISGPRTVIAIAAGGESSAVPVPANTLQIARRLGTRFEDASSSLVGVVVGTVTAAAVQRDAWSQPVGVVLGPVVVGMTPAGAIKGMSGTLSFNGVGLGSVSTAALLAAPAGSGVTLGTPVPNGDGTQVNVPFSVAANAPSNTYRLGLSSGTGSTTVAVPVNNPLDMQWRVLDLPAISSFEPLILQQGRAHSLLIRGTNLREVQRIQIDPDTGATIDHSSMVWSSDSFGEKLTVRVILAPDAPVGSRVLRLVYPGGITSSQSATNNIFSVSTP